MRGFSGTKIKEKVESRDKKVAGYVKYERDC